MILDLLMMLVVAVLGANYAPRDCSTIDFSRTCDVSYSQNTTPISISFSDDSVVATSTISGLISTPSDISNLSVAGTSQFTTASINKNSDGTFGISVVTPSAVGEYSVCLCSDQRVSIDAIPNKILSIYIYSDGSHKYASSASMDDAKMKHFADVPANEDDLILLGKKDKPVDYEPQKTRYQAEQDFSQSVYGGEDIVSSSVSSSLYLSGKIKVSGTVRWFDENQVAHPLWNVRVLLWDDDFFWDEDCGETYTDCNGYFVFLIENQTILERGGRDLFVTLYAETKSTRVTNLVQGEYLYCSPLFSNVSCDTQMTYSIDIHPGLSDRSSAFEICEAELIPANYAATMNNSKLPLVLAYYPAINNGGCYYSADFDYLAIGHDFFCDWDCLNHEYGHFIIDQLDLCDDSVGGAHYIGQDLVNDHGKGNGMKLAMSEGLATYLGTAAQMYEASNSIIPGVGDEIYASINGVFENFGEYCYGNGSGLSVGGEGNEASVTSLMIKLLDDVTRDGDEVALGHESMWNTITIRSHWSISDFMTTLISAHQNLENDICEILGREGFSPILQLPDKILSTNSSDDCWLFSWSPNGFVSCAPTAFSLIFEGENSCVYIISNLAESSLRLSNSQIASILSLAGSTIRWKVKGANGNLPLTNSYSSSFGVLQKPFSTVITNGASFSSTISPGQIEWFSFSAPFGGTFIFESAGTIDLIGEVFPSFVVDGSVENRLAYDDDGGNGTNFKVSVVLSKGQVIYLRTKCYFSRSEGSYTISASSTHVHNYSDHYLDFSSSAHKAFCSCGAYITEAHVYSGNYQIMGRVSSTCLKCGHAQGTAI